MRTYLHPRYWAVALASLAQFLFYGVLTFAVFGENIGGGSSTAGLTFGIGMLAFGLVGAVIIAQVPGNRIGWVFAFIGIIGPVGAFQQLARHLLASGTNEALVALGQLGANVGWNGFFLCLIVLVPLWYPTGKAINRYFAVAAPVAITGGVMVLLAEMGEPTVRILWDDTLPGDDAWLEIANPLAHWPVPDTSVLDIGFLLIAVSGLVAVVAMFIRLARSQSIERLQMKWLLFPEGLFVLFAMLTIPFTAQLDSLSPGWQVVLNLVLGALILAVPISVGIAITKYQLYDIDVVISKTVTYGALALFITGVYALVVVVIGTLLGGGDEPSLALSIAAVAIVAVAFEPLRNRLQRWANRLVFGHRASPYEVLSRATARLAGTDSPDEALEQVTQLVVDGTGATEAVLWLKVGGSLQPSAATPVVALEGLSDVPISGNDLPELLGQASTPVRHRGEILGALSITKPPGESMTDIDEKMLHDVASGTGLLLRNISLNTELVQRAEQLRVSRRRLVAAHDAERHRLERDLHDGAQQQVVAIKVKLGIARTLAEREDAAEVAAIVAALADDTQDAVDAMRAVAHGIYPPLLEAEGLQVAVTALGRTFRIPIALTTDALDRYERSVEETVYFCLLEIVTGAVDAGATSATISLASESDALTFSVRHDATSDDLVSVEDRIDAAGGALEVRTGVSGMVIRGRLFDTNTLAMTS